MRDCCSLQIVYAELQHYHHERGSLELAFLMQTRGLMLTRILIQRKHAGSTNLKVYDSKGESKHKECEIWVLQLGFFMQIGIGGNEI